MEKLQVGFGHQPGLRRLHRCRKGSCLAKSERGPILKLPLFPAVQQVQNQSPIAVFNVWSACPVVIAENNPLASSTSGKLEDEVFVLGYHKAPVPIYWDVICNFMLIPRRLGVDPAESMKASIHTRAADRPIQDDGERQMARLMGRAPLNLNHSTHCRRHDARRMA